MVAQRAACAAACACDHGWGSSWLRVSWGEGSTVGACPGGGGGSRRADAAAMISAKVRRSDHEARGMVSALGRVGTNVGARLQATSRKTPLGAASELVLFAARQTHLARHVWLAPQTFAQGRDPRATRRCRAAADAEDEAEVAVAGTSVAAPAVAAVV